MNRLRCYRVIFFFWTLDSGFGVTNVPSNRESLFLIIKFANKFNFVFNSIEKEVFFCFYNKRSINIGLMWFYEGRLRLKRLKFSKRNRNSLKKFLTYNNYEIHASDFSLVHETFAMLLISNLTELEKFSFICC